MTEKPFFVGYLACPDELRRFLFVAVAALLATFALTGLTIGATQDDPGAAAFRFDYGRQDVTGVVELTPYPILHITAGTDRLPTGQTIFMVAADKSGVDAAAAPLAGGLALASGAVLERGALDMLQLRNGANGLMEAAAGDVPEIAVEPLGRWLLAGEINDGKCLAGAMRPGRGLAHKACANLCLLGEVPPVFVTSQPVEGSDFMLMTGPDGTELPLAAYDFVGQFVTVEGLLSRHGSLLVFAIDPATLALAE